ncbi:hypothetical protein VitviT2T_004273 [Vitis vinifera]|uniref:Uncharacterized protein n=1 Tax=Vitis vinifera TaxID=29760 RepID=A0ABY9BPR3_VITVI|nr:hypothetical protein VitviT2T_004273 [Vitis vinifera]
MLPQCVNKTITESPNKLENLLDLANPPSTLREFVGQPQISCSTDDFTRERSQDLQRVFRNFDPSLLKQEKVVEYVRVLNAAKLDKVFAGPFIGAMDGHIDSISCAVRGLTGSTDGRILVSCGTDCTVKLWNVSVATISDLDDSSDNSMKPLAVHVCKIAFWGADHQWDAVVCTIIVAMSLTVKRLLHFLGKHWKKKNQKPRFWDSRKVKEESMLLGSFSLLLTVFQNLITEFCVPKRVVNLLLRIGGTSLSTTIMPFIGIIYNGQWFLKGFGSHREAKNEAYVLETYTWISIIDGMVADWCNPSISFNGQIYAWDYQDGCDLRVYDRGTGSWNKFIDSKLHPGSS